MRKTALVILFLSLVVGATAYFSQRADADCKLNRGWCAGNYRGLTVGQSTFDDMVRVLGKPLSSGPEADQNEPIIFIWHDYGKIKGDLPGRLGVVTNKQTKKVVGISIAPDDITKEDAIKYFGKDYQVMGYEFCEGFEDETVGPLYENPKATEITNMEYRIRGISISIDYRGRVNEIYYVAEPRGLASKDDCKKKAASK
ncbi:MAG: hypothetical protein ACKVRN_13180 [Pyrinomonadaceae bacterium]